MKKVFIIVAGALMLAVTPLRSADALTEALQKGLFEEEANQNLDAAIKAYQDVLSRADEQRRVAATALFRLAECYRKQGKTNEASAEYRRLVRDYTDQSTLVNLSRQNLTGLGVSTPAVAVATDGSAGSTDEEEKEIRRIKALIKDSPDLINARNQEIYRTSSENPRITYGTVLHQAAHKGHLQVAQYLLANRSDPNALSSEDLTPLFYAAQNGHRNMAELLLTKGASPNIGSSTSYRGTALHAASSKGFRAVAEVLLAHKADVNARDGAGKTPLHAAVEAGFLAVAEVLISNGADVNVNAPYAYGGRRGLGGSDSALTRIDLYDGTPLHFAVQKANSEMTQLLLAKGANVEARSGAGLTPLHYAGHNGNAGIAALLLQSKADVNAHGSSDSRFSGWTPLHMAVFHRTTNLVGLLLEKGADPNAATENLAATEYRTALHNAIEYGDLPTADQLLKHKADANAPSSQGITPLLRAIRKNDPAMADLLLSHDADIKATDADGNTPLVLAVKNGSVRVAERLLAKGADPNARTSDGSSLLSIVMGSRSPNQPFPAPRPIPPPGTVDVPGKTQPASTKTIIELLLDYKADVNAPIGDETSNTPLQQAVAVGATNWVRLLLEKGANPNVPWSRPDVQVRTVLHSAVEKQHLLLADLLLQHGADVNGLDGSGFTPIFRAIHGDTNIVNLLLRHNADLAAVSNDGATPLLRAVGAGKSVIAEQLLAKGANPNAADNEGHVALHIALGAKETPGVPGVLAMPGIPAGATYSPPVVGGQSLPSRTVRNPAQPFAGRPAPPSKTRSMVEVLLEQKADPNLRDKMGNTPLALAIQKRNDEAAQLLLTRKADPDQTSLSGSTPLHYAAMFGNGSGAEMLLAHKANPNAKNQDAETPVHFAAERASTNVLELLLDKGGDINACDKDGKTPLHKALEGRFTGNSAPTLQILLDRGADVTKTCEGKPSPFDSVRVKHHHYAEWFRKYHPKKLARVDLTGPVGESLWYWEANQKQTLSQVIAAVGLKEKANPGDIRILRDNPKTGLKEELPHNLAAIRAGSSQDVPVKDKDKIIVAER